MNIFRRSVQSLLLHIVAAVMVLGQPHVCNPTYVRDSGVLCTECLVIDEHHSEADEFAGPHGDCHDCCEIRECETPPTFETPASSHQPTFELAILPSPFVLPPPMGSRFPRQAFPFSGGAPATGPPLVHLSRGPPTLLFVQPSAGRKVEFLA